MIGNIKGLSFTLIICIGMLPVALQSCTHFLDMMDQVESCNQNFTSYKTLVLKGQLNNANKETVCEQFQVTSYCLQKVIRDCQLIDAVHMEHAKTILDDHIHGFGQLCDKDLEFYQRYEEHASCYTGHADETSRCLQTFTTTIEEWHRAQLEDEYNYEEDYGNPSICKSIETMYTCVQSALSDCGREAAMLYVELCQFQVPEDLEEHCLDTKPYWSEETSVASGLLSHTNTVLSLSCVALLRTRVILY